MNGVDYTKSLNRQRELFQRDVEATQRASDQAVKDANNRAEIQVKENAKAYQKYKNNLEKNYQDRYDEIETSQKEALQRKSRDYEKALNQEKVATQKTRRDNVRDWNTKISELNDEYKRNVKEESERNQKNMAQLDKIGNERVETVRKDAEKSVADYQKNMLGSSQDIQVKINSEKRELIRQHEENLNQVVKEELNKRYEIKDRVTRDIAKIREQKNLESERIREIKKDHFKKINEDANKKILQIAEGNKNALKLVNESQQSEIKNQNAIFRDKFTKQEKDHYRDMRAAELKAMSQGIGEGSMHKRMIEKQRVEEKNSANQRVSEVLNERNKLTKAYEGKLNQAEEDFQDSYRKKAIQDAKILENTKRELTEISIDERLKDRRKFTKANKDYNNNLEYSRENASRQLNDSRKQSNNKINTLKKEFNASMNDALERSRKELDIVKTEMTKEKRVLSEELHKQNSYNGKFLKKQHAEKMEKTTAKYEEKLQALRDKNTELHQVMHNKIKDVMQQTQDEIARQKKELEKAATIEKNNIRLAAEQKENALRKRLDEVQNKLQRKLNEQRIDNQYKMQQQATRLNRQVKNERQKYQELIDHNNRFFEREFMRLKTASDSERERLITQYEDRIKKLQDANIKKFRELEQFSQVQA